LSHLVYESKQPNKQLHSTIYALSVLWCRCRSTLPQGKQRVNCEWAGRYAKKSDIRKE